MRYSDTRSILNDLNLIRQNGAILTPKLTTTQRDTMSVESGQILFNTTTSTIDIYSGAS